MSKRKSHSLEFKKEVLNWIYEVESDPRSAYGAEKRFKSQVNRQAIAGWMKKKDRILCEFQKSKAQRLAGGGRKPILSHESEDQLRAVILQERTEGNRVSGFHVRRWAK